MVIVTSAQSFIKSPCYLDEVNEGTAPAAGTAISCGPVESLGIMKDGQVIDVAFLGGEDLVALIDGLNKYEIKMKLFVPNNVGINGTFITYGIKSAGYTPTPGLTGTVGSSISIYFSVMVNGVENYITVKGARCTSITLNIEPGKTLDVDMSFACTNITIPGAGAPGITFPSNPAQAVLNHLSGSTTGTSCTWGGTAVNTKKFSVTINRNTNPEWILGKADPFSTRSHGRRITGDLTTLWFATNVQASNSMETDFQNGTSGTLQVILNSSPSVTLTLANTMLVTYKRDSEANETQATVEQFTFKALTAALS